MFGPILVLWAVQSLIPGHLGIVRCGLPLMVWPQVELVIDWLLLKFLLQITPAHLADGTRCRLKFLWLVWYPSPTPGSLVLL